jgi:hypothetical protein
VQLGCIKRVVEDDKSPACWRAKNGAFATELRVLNVSIEQFSKDLASSLDGLVFGVRVSKDS